jgi:hypothetical protein
MPITDRAVVHRAGNAVEEGFAMMSKSIQPSILALALMSAPALGFAQPDILRSLQSPDWTVRARAVETIVRTPSLLASPNVRTALINLQDSENKSIEDAVRAGIDVSQKLGEEYGEYYSGPLSHSLMEFAADGDMRAAQALARGSYNPDSRLALILATYGQPLVSTLLQVAQSDIGPDRWNGVAVLGEMLRLHRAGQLRAPLAAASVKQIKTTIRGVALNDPQPVVRYWAVRALGVAGDKESLPLLETIAATDLDDGRGHTSKVDYSVRAEARRAIAAINAIR